MHTALKHAARTFVPLLLGLRVAWLPEVDMSKRTCTAQNKTPNQGSKKMNGLAYLRWCSNDPSRTAGCWAEPATVATRIRFASYQILHRAPQQQRQHQQQRHKRSAFLTTCGIWHPFRSAAFRRRETWLPTRHACEKRQQTMSAAWRFTFT
jgi:hypothetical protein